MALVEHGLIGAAPLIREKGAARLRPYEYETRNQHVSGGARGVGVKKGGPENRAALGEC